MAKIILINGPSGAGKSTTSKALLKEIDGEWAYIAQDDIRSLVLAGFESINGMPDTWSDKAKNQLAASVPICIDMAKRYHQYSINSVIDFFAAPGPELDEWLHSLQKIDFDLFLLLPDVETTLKRNQERTGTALLSDEKVRDNHALFDVTKLPHNVVVIDTTLLPVHEVVAMIKEKMAIL